MNEQTQKIADEMASIMDIINDIPDQKVMDTQRAAQEIKAWLDYRRVKKNIRITQERLIYELVSVLSIGEITIGEDMSVTQILQEPILDEEGVVKVKELVYKARIRVGDLPLMKSGSTQQEVFIAYASALTGQSTAIIGKLDSNSYNTLISIVSFFM